MIKGKIEPACYWCCELICAGHFMDVWENILHYAGKHLHIGNPKIIIYLEKRFLLFQSIINEESVSSPHHLRNHPTIRKMFAEIVATLTLSNRKHSFEPIRIKRKEEFDMNKKVKWGLAKDDVTPQDIFRMTNEGPAERAIIAINARFEAKD